MDYDIVIATANRPAMLALSLPLMLRQTRPPARLIVIDASDDPAPVERAVADATAGAEFPVILERGPRGAAHQRNAGTRLAGAPIVFYPDDDSLWYPDTAEETMRVYERDEAGAIGGVAQADWPEAPIDLPRTGVAARPLSERVKYRLASLRHRALNATIRHPLSIASDSILAGRSAPGWLENAGARLIPHLPGFRMTFRRSALPDPPFNEILRPPRTALEDFDLSLTVARAHLLAEAGRARCHHHRTPGPRADSVTTGLNFMLNLAYITCRHTEPGAPARRALKRYCRVFILEQLGPRSV
ncbi:MAG: glycosyltransferase family 2 protein, partial [Planctomycetota bacterium]